jgi:HTH-type transcriptional regulator, competence development regulator
MEAAPRVGAMIRQARAARGEPMRVVAAATGIDSTLLSKIERGERLPTSPQAEQLAQHLGLPPETLLAHSIADRILSDYGATSTTLRAVEIVRLCLQARGIKDADDEEES